MRVNARIDDATSAKIERVRSLTGWTVTDIIKRGVALVEKEQVSTEKTAWDIAVSSGIIGCAEGDSELSSNYKQVLLESLEKKLGQQH